MLNAKVRNHEDCIVLAGGVKEDTAVGHRGILTLDLDPSSVVPHAGRRVDLTHDLVFYERPETATKRYPVMNRRPAVKAPEGWRTPRPGGTRSSLGRNEYHWGVRHGGSAAYSGLARTRRMPGSGCEFSLQDVGGEWLWRRDCPEFLKQADPAGEPLSWRQGSVLRRWRDFRGNTRLGTWRTLALTPALSRSGEGERSAVWRRCGRAGWAWGLAVNDTMAVKLRESVEQRKTLGAVPPARREKAMAMASVSPPRARFVTPERPEWGREVVAQDSAGELVMMMKNTGTREVEVVIGTEEERITGRLFRISAPRGRLRHVPHPPAVGLLAAPCAKLRNMRNREDAMIAQDIEQEGVMSVL